MDDPLKTLAQSKIVHIGDLTFLIGDHSAADVPLEPQRPRWLDHWEPRRADIEFFRIMLIDMKDGGIWEVPATGAVYKLDKTAKTLTLTKGPVDEWFWKNVKTLPRIGYRVIVNKTQADGSGKSSAPTNNLNDHENPPIA